MNFKNGVENAIEVRIGETDLLFLAVLIIDRNHIENYFV